MTIVNQRPSNYRFLKPSRRPKEQLSGTSAPTVDIGKAGDFYDVVDSSGYIIQRYRKDTTDTWTSIGPVTLKHATSSALASQALTASVGTITSGQSNVTPRYLGNNRVWLIIEALVVTNGTGAGQLIAETGFTPYVDVVYQGVRIDGGSGQKVFGWHKNSQSKVFITNTDGSYPGADGADIYLTGFLEYL